MVPPSPEIVPLLMIAKVSAAKSCAAFPGLRRRIPEPSDSVLFALNGVTLAARYNIASDGVEVYNGLTLNNATLGYAGDSIHGVASFNGAPQAISGTGQIVFDYSGPADLVANSAPHCQRC